MKKYKTLISVLIFGLIVSSFSAPFVTLGAEGDIKQAPFVQMGEENIFGSTGILYKALNWIFTALIIVAAIMLIYAGFIYVTAAGDPGKVKTALNQVIYALIGVAIGVLAKGLIYMICVFVTGGTMNCNFWTGTTTPQNSSGLPQARIERSYM